MTEDQFEIARIIRKLGAASEVELQVETLKSLHELRKELRDLEKQGLVRRRAETFKGGYGDALELTPRALKSMN